MQGRNTKDTYILISVLSITGLQLRSNNNIQEKIELSSTTGTSLNLIDTYKSTPK